MPKLSLKIAYPIIIAGLFVIVAFVAFNYGTLTRDFYIIFFLLIVYIFLFGFATGQNFSSPVRKLLKSADSLSKGDLKSRFYLESKDELGELARVFNKIADNLQESRSETEMMEKSVDIKVQARTQPLEETIDALEQKIRNRTFEIQKTSTELEKLQKQTKLREMESTELKNQVNKLKEELNKGKNKKVSKLTEKEPPVWSKSDWEK
ncbi:MAG: hypothetical protein A3D34_02025 [Candidatus Staskawiczbacteria bacterium RIFCSPHIGHO2_02_FULL_33_16]|uniref:HAMP domain-containing protein n=1 Tax=Candidatus Staskawiczbacteria bacterium RIFCSPHIGHO2_02_FULL_33_16 TaxID=1802204 RepID=A0A1G2HWW9_9BACT|nr:MAG: hypothetical protein A3D34_02025 [Candidatus Staskawiczbacteria bacterium RIFCSPHIGHO2_02_FULL_33_16]OGZ70853.1 MAG: hypothetical protein A2980_02385 [Candidatus Staskawiczbacteria bacterium RIFCSPLOWO2_01_FULL_33_13]